MRQQLNTPPPLLLLLLVVALGACSSTTQVRDGLINRLKNRGPVVLSTKNPYIAANLLISREMERSEEIRGFIDYRGGPAVLEVEKEILSPLLMNFYYPENGERYVLEEIEGTWLIRGPFSISSEKQAQLLELKRPSLAHEPAFFVRDSITEKSFGPGEKKREFFDPQKNSAPPVPSPPELLPPPEATPTPDPFLLRLRAAEDRLKQQEQLSGAFQSPKVSPEPAPRIPERQAPSTERHSQQAPPASRELPAIQEIIRSSEKRPAELTPRNDLVHYVTYPGETLSMISRWYTLDRDNAGRLARINSLADPNALQIGDVIIVPSYLLKTKYRLPESAVKQLLLLAEAE